MPRPDALAGPVVALVRRVVAAAGVLRGIRHLQRLFEQRLDGAGCRFADDAVWTRRIGRIEQAGRLRGLAQELGARALAQHLGRQGFVRGVQRDAVDGSLRHGCPAGCGLRAG